MLLLTIKCIAPPDVALRGRTVSNAVQASTQQVSIETMPHNCKAASFQSWEIQQKFWWGLCYGLSLLLAGCNTTMPATPVTPIPTAEATETASTLFTGYSTDEEAIAALLIAERQAAMAHDLPVLGQLWADTAQIVDGRNSTTPNDDYLWQGRAAILDRYQVAVFPFVLPPLVTLDASAVITITGERATVQHLTDRWQLIKIDGRWWLNELKYSYLP